MKKSLILLALAFISTTAFAQDFGTITLNDGNTVFRIDVGNDRDSDSRQLTQRVARLEKAVRELQNRVYDLQDNRREVMVYTCALPTAFDGTFIGRGYTVNEARAIAINKCQSVGAFPCNDRKISSCERSTEIVRK